MTRGEDFHSQILVGLKAGFLRQFVTVGQDGEPRASVLFCLHSDTVYTPYGYFLMLLYPQGVFATVFKVQSKW